MVFCTFSANIMILFLTASEASGIQGLKIVVPVLVLVIKLLLFKISMVGDVFSCKAI